MTWGNSSFPFVGVLRWYEPTLQALSSDWISRPLKKKEQNCRTNTPGSSPPPNIVMD